MTTNYAAQLSDPVIKAMEASILHERDLSAAMVAYLYNLSVDSAQAQELAGIGELAGIPWPSSNPSAFDTSAFVYTDLAHGNLAEPNGYGAGFYVSNTSIVASTLVPIDVYRKLIKAFALLKNGLSLQVIDQIAFVFGPTYTMALGDYKFFTYTDVAHPIQSDTQGYGTGGYSGDISMHPQSDIYITYLTNIGIGYITVLNDLFSRIMTSPQVFAVLGV